MLEVLSDPTAKAILECRFWPKVDVCGPDKCWTWIAKAKHPFGYGRMTAGRGRHLKAHQVAFALYYGRIADGLIRHTCDNPSCCNPRHLIEGTSADNTADCIKRRRKKNPPVHLGSKHHNAKFDEATALCICADRRSARVIAAEHCISEMTVYRLHHGKTWKALKRQGHAA